MQEDYTELLRVVLTRLRLILSKIALLVELLLYADMQCTDADAYGLHIFHVQVNFGRIGPDGVLVLFGYPDYGQFGQADRERLRSTVRDTFEDSLTDYIRANFDR